MPSLTRLGTDRAIARHAALTQRITATQVSVTEGKLTRPSAAPADWNAAAGIRRDSANATSWQANIDRLRENAGMVETRLAELTEAATRGRELLIQARGPSGAGAGAAAVAAELTGILEGVTAALAARTRDDDPLFPDGAPREVPVGAGRRASAGPSFAQADGGLSAALTAGAAAVAANDPAAIAAAAAALDTALDNVTLEQSVQGRRLTTLNEAAATLTHDGVSRAERLSSLADTDLAEAMMRIQSGLTTLEAARAAHARITQSTLFDVLR